MPDHEADPRRQLLTHSDLEQLEVSGAELVERLATGEIEHLAAMIFADEAEPVYAVHSEQLRRELDRRLRGLGRDDVALSPLLARSRLVRTHLAGSGRLVDTAQQELTDPPRASAVAPVARTSRAPVTTIAAPLPDSADPLLREPTRHTDAATPPPRPTGIPEANEPGLQVGAPPNDPGHCNAVPPTTAAPLQPTPPREATRAAHAAPLLADSRSATTPVRPMIDQTLEPERPQTAGPQSELDTILRSVHAAIDDLLTTIRRQPVEAAALFEQPIEEPEETGSAPQEPAGHVETTSTSPTIDAPSAGPVASPMAQTEQLAVGTTEDPARAASELPRTLETHLREAPPAAAQPLDTEDPDTGPVDPTAMESRLMATGSPAPQPPEPEMPGGAQGTEGPVDLVEEDEGGPLIFVEEPTDGIYTARLDRLEAHADSWDFDASMFDSDDESDVPIELITADRTADTADEDAAMERDLQSLFAKDLIAELDVELIDPADEHGPFSAEEATNEGVTEQTEDGSGTDAEIDDVVAGAQSDDPGPGLAPDDAVDATRPSPGSDDAETASQDVVAIAVDEPASAAAWPEEPSDVTPAQPPVDRDHADLQPADAETAATAVGAAAADSTPVPASGPLGSSVTLQDGEGSSPTTAALRAPSTTPREMTTPTVANVPADVTIVAAPGLESLAATLRQAVLSLQLLAERATQIDLTPTTVAIERGFASLQEELASSPTLRSVAETLQGMQEAVESLAERAEARQEETMIAAEATGTMATIPADRAASTFVSMGAMVLGWAGILWYHTDDARMALAGLVAVSLMGSVMLGRRRQPG